jgi:hypothetical protein
MPVGRPIHPAVGHPHLQLRSGDGVFVTDDGGRTYLDA